MESGWIRKEARRGLKPDEYTVLGPKGEERAEGIQQGSSPELFKEKIWVRDVWLPKEKLLVSYGVKSERRFHIAEISEPKHSPYYKLGFTEVPGCLLPLAPVAVWRDLHELSNALFRKLGSQADAQKTVQGFGGNDDEGVEEFKKAKDGDGIKFKGAKPEKLEAGGVSAPTLAFYLQCRDLYSYFAGNLDSLGGLAPLTETVGQDKLLGEAASAQLRDMADTVVKEVKEVFTTLTWYEWHDPIGSRTLEKPIPGTNMSIPVEWNRDSKQGDIDLYELKIDTYSMQDDTPGTKLQKLNMIMSNYVFPAIPMIQQAGGTIDVQKMLEIIAKLSDLPELNEIVIFVNQTELAQQGAGAGQPAHTSREYVHSSRPGMTRQGASNTMQQSLMGGKLQDSQVQQLTGRGLA